MASASSPIGVFDSGLGGLTVVREINRHLPNERIVYVADQTHVPYGGRDLAEVRGFACGISEALLAFGCKALVMACNISSATALESVQSLHPGVPILGVIEPGADAAANKTHNGRIGVLATAGTVKSGAYTRALHAINPDFHVLEVACPQFVPLVESGKERTAEARAAACAYLAPLTETNADTVILGCTHYPFLLPVLRQIRPDLTFIDPARQTVHILETALAAQNLRAVEASPLHLLCTSGDVETFAAQLHRFLPDEADRAELRAALWNPNGLHIRSF